MDILAHTLWANAMARGANRIAERKTHDSFYISPAWTGFFGVAPDLFAFTIPFFLRFYNILIAGHPISNFFVRPRVEGGIDGFDLAQNLYQYSHSLVIWAVVFLVVWAYYKRPRYELLGWALHILIDIPSHVLAFYPTPFLFPISDYRFPHGTQWSNQWFMMINYSALLVVWGSIFIKNLVGKKLNNI